MLNRDHNPRLNGNSAGPLVERERESALLLDHLEQSLAGLGRLVLVRGKAGMGKTALVSDLARLASQKSVLVLTGHCYDQTMIRPYGPWVEVGRDYEQQIARSAITAAPAPDALRQLWAEEHPTAAQSQLSLFETVINFLVNASQWCPLCLVLEDLHWSDQSSVDLLRFAGRQLSTIPLLVVATYRDDELTPGTPLAQRLPNLVREAGAHRIVVQPLSDSALATLVKERFALPSEDSKRLVEILMDLTQGNALYASELLRSFEEEGVLFQTSGGWRLGDVTHVHVPELLREVIDGRLARLSAEARSALQVAAVIGQEVPLDLWRSVCQLDELELLDIADEAFEARILEEGTSTDRPRFHHALIREALLGSLHGPRRRVWHVRIAEAHATNPRPEPDRVAHHFEQANDPRAVDWLIEAGRRAQMTYSMIEAADAYEAAAHRLEGDTGRERIRGWLLYWVGNLRRYDDPPRALRVLQDALRMANQVDDPLLTSLVSHCAGHLLNTVGDIRNSIEEIVTVCRSWDAALRSGAFDDYDPPLLAPSNSSVSVDAHRKAARALAHAPEQPVTVAWGSATVILAFVGYIQVALATGRQLAALWPPVPETAPGVAVLHHVGGSSWADAFQGLGMAEAMAGRPDEARRAFASARSIYRMVDHRVMLGNVYSADLELVLLNYYTDDVDERRRITERGAATFSQVSGAIASASNLPLAAVTFRLAQVEGRWSEADIAKEAYAASVGGVTFWRSRLGTPLATLARDRGETQAAWEYVHDLLPQGAATRPGGHPIAYVLEFQRVAADLAMDAGDLTDAEAWLSARDHWLEWSNIVPGRAEGQLLWARYCRLTGNIAAAGQHARAALELASEPRQPHMLFKAHRAVGELETAMGHLDEAAHHLNQALTMATACAMPYERMLSLLALAELRSATGEIEDARALLADARAIGESLGATLALARADALETRIGTTERAEPPARLSPREIDVLQRIAAGRSNKEIAYEFAMSLRTVERHSANLYAKLGVASRAEAIAFAHQHGLIER